MNSILLTAFLWAFASPLPSPALSPEQVVRTLVDALAHVHSPTPNAGVRTTYQFASPANRAVTGPYGHFLGLVKSPDYAVLLQPGRAEYAPLSGDLERARQVVRITGASGRVARFQFDLTRQSAGACRGCWLVDTVLPLP